MAEQDKDDSTVDLEDQDTDARDDSEDTEDRAAQEEEDEAAAQSGAEAPELSAEDKAWLDMKRYGLKPQQIIQLAQEGWDSQQRKEKAAAEAKDAAPVENEDEYEPMSKAEHKKAMREMQEAMEGRMRISNQAARNQIALDSALDNSPVSDNPQARDMISRGVYEKAAGGMPMKQAVKETLNEFKGLVASLNKSFFKKKVKATNATGGSTAAEPMTAAIPELEHDASDFHTGVAMDQALALLRSRRH